MWSCCMLGLLALCPLRQPEQRALILCGDIDTVRRGLSAAVLCADDDARAVPIAADYGSYLNATQHRRIAFQGRDHIGRWAVI